MIPSADIANIECPEADPRSARFILNQRSVVKIFARAYTIPIFLFLVLAPIKLIQIWQFINNPKFQELSAMHIAINIISLLIILFSYLIISIPLGRFVSRHLSEPWPSLFVKTIALSLIMAMFLSFEIYGIFRTLRVLSVFVSTNDLFYFKTVIYFWPIFVVLNLILIKISKTIISKSAPNQSFNPDPTATV